MSHSPITIGTVKPRINRDFKSLFSKKFSIIIIQGIVGFHTLHYSKKRVELKTRLRLLVVRCLLLLPCKAPLKSQAIIQGILKL